MTDEILEKCICRQLLALGVADALENAEQRDQMFSAMQACLDKSLCLEGLVAIEEPTAPAHPGAGDDDAPDDTPSRRKHSDRRSGIDRRKTKQQWSADKERRAHKERRSGGDRRGLLAGKQYTPQEAFLNLKAWCNGHCQGPFELGLEPKTGNLRFHFDLNQDRVDFMEMLRLFKGMSAIAR